MVEGALVRGGNCEADILASLAANVTVNEDEDANAASLAINAMDCARMAGHAMASGVTGRGDETLRPVGNPLA